jgi:DNA transposition AAA+ family ATPase
MFTGIRNEIKAAVENGEKYSAIAKQSDVSPAALSQFMNDLYSGDNQKIADKLTVWLDNKKKANNLKTAPSFVETPTSKKIFNALDYAKIAGCFVVVYGNSGVGKTNAITEYAKQPNTWLITVRPSSAKLLECLHDIACALDIDYAPKRLGTLSSTICKKMRETKGLLIIDDF